MSRWISTIDLSPFWNSLFIAPCSAYSYPCSGEISKAKGSNSGAYLACSGAPNETAAVSTAPLPDSKGSSLADPRISCISPQWLRALSDSGAACSRLREIQASMRTSLLRASGALSFLQATSTLAKEDQSFTSASEEVCSTSFRQNGRTTAADSAVGHSTFANVSQTSDNLVVNDQVDVLPSLLSKEECSKSVPVGLDSNHSQPGSRLKQLRQTSDNPSTKSQSVRNPNFEKMAAAFGCLEASLSDISSAVDQIVKVSPGHFPFSPSP
ncbi:unnamed protein product [Protopolystoma xenopodis]|uniref:Uncharacterized protein n=1 Tax=Protopolystoma xenopodis TaxID=117903 RepID=A0A3S5FF08_9PLAT|nr:unnamed protein product [Protopolystoma xenopodis]